MITSTDYSRVKYEYMFRNVYVLFPMSAKEYDDSLDISIWSVQAPDMHISRLKCSQGLSSSDWGQDNTKNELKVNFYILVMQQLTPI